jgi:hypothetical protein
MFSYNRIDGIARLRFRVAVLLAMRECLKFFIVWLMIWAVVIAGLRAIFRVDPSLLLWGALGLIVAVIAGVVRAIHKVPVRQVVRAVLDRHDCLGGLLMTAGETDIGLWSPSIATVTLPVLRWQSRRQWMLLFASAGFLMATFLAPDRYLPSSDDSALQIAGEIHKLTDKIQLLKQEQILRPEKVQAIEQNLSVIRQEATGKDPAKTLEALDHLEHSLNDTAVDAAEAAAKQIEAIRPVQELAEALPTAKSQMNPEQFNDAMKELAKISQEAAAENQSLADNLSDELKEALKQSLLTDEQLRELCKSLKECKLCERAKLAKLINAKLIDAAELIECESGEYDEAALIDALRRCKDGSELAEAIALANASRAGKGGPGGGGPPAIMTWSQGTDPKGVAFKEKLLPPASMASMKKSRLVGVSAGDPRLAKPGGGSVGGALASAHAGGGEARTQIILPEHEKTVQRYFSREKK